MHKPRDEVRRLWSSSEYRPEYIEEADAAVEFKDARATAAPRSTSTLELDAPAASSARSCEAHGRATPLAKVKDELRRFKQQVETGEIPRSDGTPEGERVERKLKQRPAQPLSEAELEKVGVR